MQIGISMHSGNFDLAFLGNLGKGSEAGTWEWEFGDSGLVGKAIR